MVIFLVFFVASRALTPLSKAMNNRNTHEARMKIENLRLTLDPKALNLKPQSPKALNPELDGNPGSRCTVGSEMSEAPMRKAISPAITCKHT